MSSHGQVVQSLRHVRLFLVFLVSSIIVLIGVFADLGAIVDNARQALRTVLYPELCIAGSNTIMGSEIGLAVALKRAFEEPAHEPPPAVEVLLNDEGTTAAIERASSGGCVDVLVSSDALTLEQFRSLTSPPLPTSVPRPAVECADTFGYDAVAFITNRAYSGLNAALTLDQLVSIMKGEVQNWREVGGADQSITIVDRGGGTSRYLNETFVGHPWTPDDPFPSDNYLACPNDNQTCMTTVMNTPGGLLWVSSAWLRDNRDQFFDVIKLTGASGAAINPVTDASNIVINEYPRSLVRPLYMYALRRPNGHETSAQMARSFINLTRDVIVGQPIVSAHGFFSYAGLPRPDDLALWSTCWTID